jgi:hypothetical protein
VRVVAPIVIASVCPAEARLEVAVPAVVVAPLAVAGVSGVMAMNYCGCINSLPDTWFSA